jgi:excisionase family DNA binding protein
MRRYGHEDQPELLTVEEAARYLRVSRRTLDRWQAESIGPPSIKLPSGARRYRRTDLDRWLTEHQEEE